MNNLEFRYFDSVGKFFQYSSQFDWPDNFSKLEKFFSMASRYANGVVQQYTGLTDSTGKKIFEGDIIKWDDASNGKYWRVAQVIWHERGSWCFRIIPNKSVNCFPHRRTNDFMMGNFIYSPNPNEHGNVLQVIGNIFETPELVKP